MLLEWCTALEDTAVGTMVREVAFPYIEGTHVLAWALYKNGRCGEAERVSERALALGPNDVDALLHRVLIERCLGRPFAASSFLSRARGLDPTAPLPSAFRLLPRIAAWPGRSNS